MSYTRKLCKHAEQVKTCLTASIVLGTSNLNDLSQSSVIKYNASIITELLLVPIYNINK